MASTRSKRTIKPPKHLEDWVDPTKLTPIEPMAVYRLLQPEELGRSLQGAKVFVLWPDNNVWYQAVIKKFRARDTCATLYYTRTQEVETDINLKELVEEQQIAMREVRPYNHQLVSGEILVTKDNQEEQFSIDDANDDVSADDSEGEQGSDESDAGSDAAAAEDEVLTQQQLVQEERPLHTSALPSAAPVSQWQAPLAANGDGAGLPAGSLLGPGPPNGVPQVLHTSPAALSGSKRKADALETVVDFQQARKLSEGLLQSLMGAGFGTQTAPLKSKAPPVVRLDERRSKLRSTLLPRLQKAVAEVTAAGEEDQLQYSTQEQLQQLATQIEIALYEMEGAVSKEYGSKARSLLFNLNEASNPELRGGIVRGNISPHRLVRMQPDEMAPKQLQQERQKLKEKSLKMSVLPEGAEYINYVTRREELVQKARERTPPVRGVSPEVAMKGKAIPNSAQPPEPPQLPPSLTTAASPKSPPAATQTAAAAVQQVVATAGETAHLGESVGANAKEEPTTAAPSIDWAAIKTQAAKQEEQDRAVHDELAKLNMVAAETDFTEADGLPRAPEAGQSDMSMLNTSNTTSAPSAAGARQSPRTGPSRDPPAGAHRDPRQARMGLPPELADVQPLVGIWDGSGNLGAALGSTVWPQGVLSVPGQGQYAVSGQFLCGIGQLEAMLRGQKQLEMEGRVSEEKLQRFLEDLKLSRSRTVTLGMLSPASNSSEDNVEQFGQMVDNLSSRSRTGVTRQSGLEFYQVAAGILAQRLLRSTYDALLASGRIPQGLVPASLTSGQLLLLVVHTKNWKPPTPQVSADVAVPDVYDPLEPSLSTIPSGGTSTAVAATVTVPPPPPLTAAPAAGATRDPRAGPGSAFGVHEGANTGPQPQSPLPNGALQQQGPQGAPGAPDVGPSAGSSLAPSGGEMVPSFFPDIGSLAAILDSLPSTGGPAESGAFVGGPAGQGPRFSEPAMQQQASQAANDTAAAGNGQADAVAGIDMNQLSALAAMLGVAPAASIQEGPLPGPSQAPVQQGPAVAPPQADALARPGMGSVAQRPHAVGMGPMRRDPRLGPPHPLVNLPPELVQELQMLGRLPQGYLHQATPDFMSPSMMASPMQHGPGVQGPLPGPPMDSKFAPAQMPMDRPLQQGFSGPPLGLEQGTHAGPPMQYAEPHLGNNGFQNVDDGRLQWTGPGVPPGGHPGPHFDPGKGPGWQQQHVEQYRMEGTQIPGPPPMMADPREQRELRARDPRGRG